MRINELQSSTTHSVELIELILRERETNNDESRREINFLLTRMIGYPHSYEEVTTNDVTTLWRNYVDAMSTSSMLHRWRTRDGCESFSTIVWNRPLRTSNKWSVKSYPNNTRQCLYVVFTLQYNLSSQWILDHSTFSTPVGRSTRVCMGFKRVRQNFYCQPRNKLRSKCDSETYSPRILSCFTD